jgi:hypothetical protein
MSAVLLDYAEGVLRLHDPANFERTVIAGPECTEAVRAVEDEEAWKARYRSLDEFYAAQESRHPDIRYYGEARREILASEPLTTHGTVTQRIARLREADP